MDERGNNNMTNLKNHHCTLINTNECVDCENYFWENVAEHSEDNGLQLFFQRRIEALEGTSAKPLLSANFPRRGSAEKIMNWVINGDVEAKSGLHISNDNNF